MPLVLIVLLGRERAEAQVLGMEMLLPHSKASSLASSSPTCSAHLDALTKCDMRIAGTGFCSLQRILDSKAVRKTLNCSEESLETCQRNCLDHLAALGVLPLTSAGELACSVQDQLLLQYSGKPQLVVNFARKPDTGLLEPMLLPSSLLSGSPSPFVSYLGDYQSCMQGAGMQYCLLESSVSLPSAGPLMLSALMGLCQPVECQAMDVHDAIAPLAKASGIRDFKVDCHVPGAPSPPLAWSSGKLLSLLLMLLILTLFLAGCFKALRKQNAEPPATPPEPSRLRTLPGRMVATVVDAWSLKRNLKSYWATRDSGALEVSLDVLDGLRVLSTLWVILGHVVIWPMLSIQYQNAGMILPPKGRLTEIWFQIVPGGYFAVDTFFWLSGFLGARALHAKVRRTPTLLSPKGFMCKLYPISVLARWLRLSFIYAFILLFSQTWFSELGRGSLLWNAGMASRMGCASSIDNDACKKYWWANLLYINNLVPNAASVANSHSPAGCLAHGWYLACDMQLFLLLPFLVLLRERAGKVAAWTALAALTLASVAANAWVIFSDHMVSDPLFGNIGSSTGDFMQKVYEVSWMRAQPYLIGVGTAWILESLLANRLSARSPVAGPTLLHSSALPSGQKTGVFEVSGPTPLLEGLRHEESRPELSLSESSRRASKTPFLNSILLQLLSFFLMVSVVVLPVTRYRCESLLDCINVNTSPWPVWLNVAYGSLNHAIWALGLAILMLLCFLRSPGTWWLQTLLGGKAWQPLVKLTYAAYLLHPLVLVYVYCQRDTSLHYLDSALFMNFVSFSFFVFALSFVLWLLVEKPCANLTARGLAAIGAGGSGDH